MTTIFIDDEPHYWADGPPGAFVPLAEADALEAQIAALTTERDALKLQADGLKQHAAQSLIKYTDAAAECEGLIAERDSLRAALQQAQDERGRLRDALTDMLYIFDRGLPDNSLGRMRCDQARDALNPPNQQEQGEQGQ